MSARNGYLSPGKSGRRAVKPEPQELRLDFIPKAARKESNNPTSVIYSDSSVKVEVIDPSAALNKSILSPSRRPNAESAARQQSNSKRKQEEDVSHFRPLAEVSLNFTQYRSASEIKYTPEDSMKEGLKMIKDIKYHVNRLELGNSIRKEVWLKEIKSLESQASPSTMIAICGATGAGKSSLLNAILDDNIVPTSGMRACTAVVTEIAYHKDKIIAADVTFLSAKEWRDELAVLLSDLTDEDGSIKRKTDLRSEAGVAWYKVHAVYPVLTPERLARIKSVDDLINLDPYVAKHLGSVKKIVAKDTKQFSKEIAKYIDSKDQKRGSKKDKERKKIDDGPALWPLIRQVNVRCPAEALRTGAILVDLPGVADANTARSSIARDYMKKCDCIWIVAPITRAVDDKVAKDLLGDAFKSQFMNGGFSDIEGKITFVATKCDDISCAEVINALGLEDDELEEIEARLENVREEVHVWKTRKSEAENTFKQITRELRGIRNVIAEHKEHIKAIEEGTPFIPKRAGDERTGKKRKSSGGVKKGSSKRRKKDEDNDSLADEELEEMLLDSDADMDVDDFIDDRSDVGERSSDDRGSDSSHDSSDTDNDGDGSGGSDSEDEDDNDAGLVERQLSVGDVKAKLTAKKEDLTAVRGRLNEVRKQRKDAIDALSGLEKMKVKTQREKNAYCSMRRSEFSREVLKEDFRAGLKELDDADKLSKDPDNFDPSVKLRDYDKINLPTFTVSARDYVRIKKQIEGDGDPTCFTNPRDTGVPELQGWCQALTVKSRQRGARAFRNHIRVFAMSVKSYVDNIGAISEGDREALRGMWQTPQSESLYTLNADDYDDDLGITWVYQHGRLIPKLRDSEECVRSPHSTKDSDKERGIRGRLSGSLDAIVKENIEEMQTLFKDGLEDKCQLAAQRATQQAVETNDEFSMGMHWCTYRATLRRDGEWRANLNEELTAPMTRVIASSWAQVFESDMLSSIETKVAKALEGLLVEFEESCPIGLLERAKQQGQLCIEETKVALVDTIDIVSAQLSASQKDVSRCLAPTVRGQMYEGYRRAMEERGRGSITRQKNIMHSYVSSHKQELFENGADALLDGLDKIASSVGAALKTAFKDLATKVEVNLSVLWEDVDSDSPRLAHDRHQAIASIDTILSQLSLWDLSCGKYRHLQNGNA